MALFKRNIIPTEESSEFENYVENLVNDADPDITKDIESHLSTTKPAYGICDAVNLMRKLPIDNSDMVINIVRETLRSANIDIDSIVSDADVSLANTERRLSELATEIDDLQSLVLEKQSAIDLAKIEVAETQKVKDLLIQSQDIKLQTKMPNADINDGAQHTNISTSNSSPAISRAVSASIDNNSNSNDNHFNNLQIRQS